MEKLQKIKNMNELIVLIINGILFKFFRTIIFVKNN